MAKRLSGKETAAALAEKIRLQAEELKSRGIFPELAILRVGERPDDLAYERAAMKRCDALGVAVRQVLLPADVGQETLLASIAALNEDPDIHGVLMFRPLPVHLDEAAACRALAPAKDVDGITEGSLAGVFTGQPVGFPPCTARACMEILEHFGVECAGKRAVVVGRSLVVGKPVSMMLLAKNATVTICHSRSRDLPAICREADILVATAGQAGMIGEEYLSGGQILIDVGINVAGDGSLVGDVDPEAAEERSAAFTPVPGGVGTVTSTVLAGHVVEAAARIHAL